MRELASCFQCQCVMAGPGISLEIGDALRIVCSRECELAAQQIGDLGLARFYDYRERFKAGALPSVDVEQPRGREPGRDDERRLALAAGVQHVRGVSRLSVRVPDIRCAACTWLIESSLRKRPDVLRCMTSLADRIVTVEYRQADPLTFVTFIEGLGFTVLPDRSAPVRSALERERKSLLARLGVAGIGMMQVMMYALTTYVAGDAGIEPAYEALMRWASLAITTPVVLFSAMPFHRGAWRDLRHFSPGMDVPVSIAILAAFGLSLMNTILGGGEVYFDSVTMFTFLLLIGRTIELGGRHRYQQSQIASENLLPASARLAATGERVPTGQVAVDDLIEIAAGETISVDGIVMQGSTSVVEAAFTGESTPVLKSVGSRVLAGADNLDGAIQVKATVVADEFVISRIAALYRDALLNKPRFSLLADVVARYFVLGVLLVASGSGIYWYVVGNPAWFSIALSVLVVSCPCALSLATPVAYTVAVAAMRARGVVINSGACFERLAQVSRIVFDKTGTLTRGRFRVEEIISLGDMPESALLDLAAVLEQGSRHPLALAFERPITREVGEVNVVPGAGVSGTVEGEHYRLGKVDFATDQVIPVPAGSGTWVLLAGKRPLGWFRLSDEVRPEAKAVIEALSRTLPVSMFTGDVSDEAMRLGHLVGIQEIHAGLTPADKCMRLEQYQLRGDRVLMIGDGVNDTVAMGVADVSLAISPVDIMVQEAADATLLHADLNHIPMTLTFARKVERIIWQNVIWAVGYNLCAIPLAVTGHVVPWVAALGMSLSSVFVVLNAGRLHKVN